MSCFSKCLNALTNLRLAARQAFFSVSCILFNCEDMHYSFLKPHFLSGSFGLWSCLVGEVCLFLIEIISQKKKSCPCEKSDFLAMHQNAEECQRIEVDRGNCMRRIFFCYRLSKETNSSHSTGWQLIATSKPLYNHYPCYLIFMLALVLSTILNLGPAASVKCFT